MAHEDLRSKTIEEVLSQVNGLSAVANPGQMQSLMALVARCTIEVADSLRETSKEMGQAAKEIRTTSSEIRLYNESTTKLTEQIIRLNCVLTWATIFIAVGTFAAAFITLFKK